MPFLSLVSLDAGAALKMDFSGEQGGIAAVAHMAGWAAATVFWAAIGKVMWTILGKAKDDTIADLKKTIEKNEERCAETIEALSNRVKQLETLLLLHGPGDIRQELQRAMSDMELRLQTSGVKP